MTQPMRMTRARVDRLPTRTDEHGPVRMEAPDTLWVLAAGSLSWNPRCDMAERRAARADGWRRSFCLGPDRRFGSSPSKPGLMMSLDRQGECHGGVMRIQGDDVHPHDTPVPPRWVRGDTAVGQVMAIASTADPTSVMYCAEPDEAALAGIPASSVGNVGTMAEYLLNTVTELEKAGIHDPPLWRLQEMVAERLARLPERLTIQELTR